MKKKNEQSQTYCNYIGGNPNYPDCSNCTDEAYCKDPNTRNEDIIPCECCKKFNSSISSITDYPSNEPPTTYCACADVTSCPFPSTLTECSTDSDCASLGPNDCVYSDSHENSQRQIKYGDNGANCKHYINSEQTGAYCFKYYDGSYCTCKEQDYCEGNKTCSTSTDCTHCCVDVDGQPRACNSCLNHNPATVYCDNGTCKCGQ